MVYQIIGGSMSKLLEKIKNRKASIGVIGLGYVGLPLSVEYALSGYKVYGIDLLEEKVKMLKSGKSYIIDVKKSNIKEVIKNKLLIPSTDYAAIKNVDIVIIAVPTPLRKSKDPDTSYITNAINSMEKYLHKDMLIVLESTTYPGTTRELIADRISDIGFILSKDIFIAFSPERVDPGNKEYNTKNTPKVVGGLGKKDAEIACAIYSEVIENIVKVDTLEEAEMVKLLENTFRAVNIGLVNELAIMCHRMNIDIWNVINAAATKPFGFMPFFPGPGIGGHCIPLDPMYLAWRAKMYDYYNRFIELSSDVNSNMPRFIVGKIGELLNKHKKSVNGSKILLMGIAYKKDIDDLRESPSLEIYKLLKEEGATVDYVDTYVPFFINYNKRKISRKKITKSMIKTYDIIILLTNHSNFDYQLFADNAKMIFDTRNGFKAFEYSNIIKL